MHKHLHATLLALLIVAAAPASAETPAAEAPQDPMAFARGANAWAETCGGCHNLRDARDLRDDQWRASIAHMRVRAHLTRQETQDITRFLQGSN